jgi:site-specific recombinase XerD
LLALNGLRVSEATGANMKRWASNADIEPSPSCVRAIPLAPRTARAVDLAVGERCEGPILLGVDGNRLDRHGAGRIVRRVAKRAGITKLVSPNTLRHAFITAVSTPGCRFATCRRRRRTLTREHHAIRPGTGVFG